MLKIKSVSILICFFSFVHVGLLAGTVLYDDSRGLSNNQINRILKDITGLLWIGTANGLNTFDGYNFKELPFFKKKIIYSLFYDAKQNAIWVGSNEGLFIYNIITGSITDCTKGMPDKAVMEVFQYGNHKYIIFLHGTIIKVDEKGNASPVFGIKHLALQKREFRKIAGLDKAGILYLAIDNFVHLVSINLNSGKVFFANEIPAKEVWTINSIKGKCIVSVQNKGIVLLGKKSGDSEMPLGSQQNYRIGFLGENNGEYYASLRGFYGLYHYDKLMAKWTLMESDDNVSFRSKGITTIWCDAYNVVWIGTNKGLIKMTLTPPRIFKTLFDGYSPSVSTRQIVENGTNELYVASYNGIYHFNRTKNKAFLIDSTEHDSVFPLYTRTLYRNKKGYLYAGTETHENFMYRVNLNRNFCEGSFFLKEPKSLHVTSVYSMYKGSGGLLWMATDKGIASYNEELNVVKLHTGSNFNVGEVKLFYINKSSWAGKFWLAGRGCLFLVDEINGIEKRYTSSTKEFKLNDDDYIFVNEDVKGRVWVTAKKTGVVMMDFKNNVTEYITRAQGLSSNEVYGVLWQNDQIGWFSTVNGLCRYDVDQKTFNNYFYEDGLSDNEFNQNSLLKASDGTFYLGGINGINYFKPEKVKAINDKLTIFNASALKWNQASQSFKELNATGVIRMEPNDHLLSFTFGLSDYSSTDAYSYFYKISGIYNDWVSLGSQNILRLEGLPAGNYLVEVIGYNKRGIRSSNTLSYQIEIIQVFYKTWWFYVLIAFGVILLVYGYFKWRLQTINQKLKLRTQIASNLHDEVGSLLTSIIISTDSARYSSDTMDEKDEKLEKISALSRNATSTMSDVLWSIDARNDYAGNLTDRMREHAESMLMPMEIEVEFDLSSSQQNQNIDPETRQQLYLIFKEAINNIAKHSKATLVKVSYMHQGQKFRLRIENNNDGKKNDLQTSHHGQGLKNMEMRASKIRALCRVLSHNGWFIVEIIKQ